jgi:transcriptional regulator with XRE-family HTH domain
MRTPLVRLDRTAAQEAREAAGLSQAEVAVIMGSSQPNVCTLEGGRPVHPVTVLAYAYIVRAESVVRLLAADTDAGALRLLDRNPEDDKAAAVDELDRAA